VTPSESLHWPLWADYRLRGKQYRVKLLERAEVQPLQTIEIITEGLESIWKQPLR
jgi:hypothetical protein